MNARPSPLEVLHDYMEMTNNYLFDDKNVDQDPIRILDQWGILHIISSHAVNRNMWYNM